MRKFGTIAAETGDDRSLDPRARSASVLTSSLSVVGGPAQLLAAEEQVEDTSIA